MRLNAAHQQSRNLPPDTDQIINLAVARISTFGKAVEPAARLIPAVGHLYDIPRHARCPERFEQHHAAVLVALGDDLHSAVDQVFCHAKQAELQGDAPDPPAEADALYPPAHPGGQPGLLAQRVRDVSGQVSVSMRSGVHWVRPISAVTRVPVPSPGPPRPCRAFGWPRG